MKRSTVAAPATFECRCGTIHHAPAGQFPVGWSTCHAMVWCADCTRAGIPARELRTNTTAGRRRRAA